MAKEYIERDAVTRALARFRKGFQFEEAKCVVDGCILEVKAVPPEEVVEVVRCKDCKYWEEDYVDAEGFVLCPALEMEVTDMDFCSCGERRDNNATR